MEAADEMTLKEAGDALGVTRHRIHAMIRQGQLTSERRTTPYGTEYLVVKRADVDELRAERERRAAGDRPKGVPGPAPKSGNPGAPG